MREDVQQTELVIGCFHPAYISERSLTCSEVRFEPLLEPTARGFFLFFYIIQLLNKFLHRRKTSLQALG